MTVAREDLNGNGYSKDVDRDNLLELQGLDKEQLSLMDKEICIQVDKNDKLTGSVTKKEAHLMKNISKGLLHRAFSVFLFNTKHELLLQQRADSKITFPGYLTNTCCSHPIFTPEELVEEDCLGLRRAARRKLFHELGIPPEQVPLSDIVPITRIHYLSPSGDDKFWGEHEIDYILIFVGNVKIQVNPDEVSSVKYVSRYELRDLLNSDGIVKLMILAKKYRF